MFAFRIVSAYNFFSRKKWLSFYHVSFCRDESVEMQNEKNKKQLGGCTRGVEKLLLGSLQNKMLVGCIGILRPFDTF